MTIREQTYKQNKFLLPTGTGWSTEIEITKLHRGHKLHMTQYGEHYMGKNGNRHCLTYTKLQWY